MVMCIPRWRSASVATCISLALTSPVLASAPGQWAHRSSQPRVLLHHAAQAQLLPLLAARRRLASRQAAALPATGLIPPHHPNLVV